MEKMQQICNALAAAGLDVYAPGEHIGPCISPYCVVQPTGGSLSDNTGITGSCGYRIYSVVPYDSPALIESMTAKVRTALAAMVSSGALRLSSPCSTLLTDDTFSALICHIDYTCYYSERN